jgi:hypothetical protein
VVTVKYTLIAKKKNPGANVCGQREHYDLNTNVSSTVSATKTAYPNRLRQKCCGALVRIWHIASVSGLPGMAAIKG